MRALFGLAAWAVMVLARTDVMVPLYVYPGNASWTNPEWAAAVSAIEANPDLHFYIVLNPNSGPLNTSDPTGRNGGYCNAAADAEDYIPHGCNRDWTTHLATLTNLPNAQPLGYVYTQYGARDTDAIKADIAEWAAWDTAPTWALGTEANISVAGLWFDEIGAEPMPGNASLVEDLLAYAKSTFASAREARGIDAGDRLYTTVLNAGPVANASYEAHLFGLADAVVTKETCYTSDAAALGAAVAADCPEPYAPFDVSSLTPGNGLPHDAALVPQAVVIVHQFVGPPTATEDALRVQVEGVAQLGVHSTYFTSGSWHQTTLQPATIGTVGKMLDKANGAAARVAGAAWFIGWVPWVCAFLHLWQGIGDWSVF